MFEHRSSYFSIIGGSGRYYCHSFRFCRTVEKICVFSKGDVSIVSDYWNFSLQLLSDDQIIFFFSPAFHSLYFYPVGIRIVRVSETILRNVIEYNYVREMYKYLKIDHEIFSCQSIDSVLFFPYVGPLPSTG